MKKKTFSGNKFKAKSKDLLEQDLRTGKTVSVTGRGTEKPVPGKLRDTLVEETDLVTPFGKDLWKAGKPK